MRPLSALPTEGWSGEGYGPKNALPSFRALHSPPRPTPFKSRSEIEFVHCKSLVHYLHDLQIL